MTHEYSNPKETIFVNHQRYWTTSVAGGFLRYSFAESLYLSTTIERKKNREHPIWLPTHNKGSQREWVSQCEVEMNYSFSSCGYKLVTALSFFHEYNFVLSCNLSVLVWALGSWSTSLFTFVSYMAAQVTGTPQQAVVGITSQGESETGTKLHETRPWQGLSVSAP